MSATTLTTTQLQGRARRLRAQAASLHPVVAETYRRRAAELDRQALLESVWNPAIDWGDIPAIDVGIAPTGRAASHHLAVA
jgi:hypothetical protein